MGTAAQKRLMQRGLISAVREEDDDDGGDGGAKNEVQDTEKSGRPFLKKGSGLSRYYKGQPPKRYLKLRKCQENNTEEKLESSGGSGLEKTNCNGDNLSGGKTQSSSCRTEDNPKDDPEDEDELRLFEEMEKAAVAASFCSTSSLAAHFLRTKMMASERDPEKEMIDDRKADVEAYSPPSSLFDSDDDDDIDDEEEEEEEEKDAVVVNFKEKPRDVQVVKSPSSSLPLPTFKSHDLRILEEENTCLKARVVYLEEKMEKNTLEWWSFKEKMVNIIQGLQTSISRRDSQLESMQNALTKRIENLADDIRNRGQKWGETHVQMVEKTQLIEDELHSLSEKLSTTRNKVIQKIDDVESELRNTALEWSAAQDHLEQRISAVEGKRARSSSQLKEIATSPLDSNVADSVKESVGDSIFGNTDEEDGEEGVTKTLPNGDRETVYSNGTRKVISRDLSEMRHLYTNGDIRITKRDGTVKYFYVDSGTWHTTFTNGVEYYEFANGQVERRNPNGVVEIVFTNGCVKYSHPTGTEECIFADNTILRVEPTGERSVVLPNGQKEVYRQDYKKRIYPDGTTKIIYSDGTQETRYPNGRVRIKGGDGSLLADIADNKSKVKLSKKSSSQTA